MATPKPTPEEKLFAVIQGAQQPPIRRAKAAAWPQLTARVASAIGPFDLPRVNQLLMALAALLALLCATTPLFMRPSISAILNAVGPQPVPVIPKPLDGLKSLETYQEILQTQDPFRIAAAPSTAAPDEPIEPPPPDPKTLLSEAKLVGISWGAEPVAMVEQQEQTFFLKLGDALGGLTVKEILKDRVVFETDGQDVELQ